MAAVAEISESDVLEPSPKRPKIEGDDDDDGESSGGVVVGTFSDSDDDTDPEKVRMKQEYEAYQDQYEKTEGFGIVDRCELPYIGLTCPVDLSGEDRLIVKKVEDCMDFVMQMKPDLRNQKILHTTCRYCGHLVFNITFEAEEESSGAKNIYQARVCCKVSGKKLILLRPKPEHHDYLLLLQTTDRCIN